MKEYRISKKLTTFWGCAALVVIGVGMGIFFEVFERYMPQSGLVFCLELLLALFFPVLFVGLWVHLCFLRYLTYPDKIVVHSVFKRRELSIKDALGFVERASESRILLLPKAENKKLFAINTYVKNGLELECWIFTNLTDLKEVEAD